MVELSLLLEQRRFQELRSAVDELECDDDGSWRARAELAAFGRGPVADALLAARRALRDGWADARHVLGLALRALGDVDAHELADSLIDEAEGAWSIDLASLRGARGASAALLEARATRDAAASARILEELAEHAGLDERLVAMRLLAELARHRGDYAASCAWHRRARALAPFSDEAPELAIRGALDAWVAGERDDALASLREVRALDGFAARAPAQRAERLLQALERSEHGSHTWEVCPAARLRVEEPGLRGAVALIARWLEHDAPDVPHEGGLPQLRRVLAEMDVGHLRVRATPALISAAFRAGALLIFGDEDEAGAVRSVAVGWDASASLLEVRSPQQWGGSLVCWDEYAPHLVDDSESALLVIGTERCAELLRELDVLPDPLFDALDAMQLNEDGEAPPFSEVVALAEKVLALDPSCRLARKRWLRMLSHGNQLHSVNDETLLAGIAQAQEQVPFASWVSEVHATWLQGEGRRAEAAIAWADARRAEPGNTRYQLAEAQALLSVGLNATAEPLLRSAASTQREWAHTSAALARAAHEQGALERALAASELSVALDPENAGVLATRAVVLEASDQLEAATTMLERAVQHSEGDVPQWLVQLARRHAAEGRFEQGASLLRPLLETPHAHSPSAYAEIAGTAARLELSRGELSSALAILTASLAHGDAPEPQLELLVRVLALTTAPGEERAQVWSALTEGRDDASLRSKLALALTQAGWHELASSWLHASGGLEDPSEAWLAARTLLYSGRRDERALAATERVVELVPQFDTPRVLLALATPNPEAALELTHEEVRPFFSGAVWYARWRALHALGRHDDAASQRERILGLPPSMVADAVRNMRSSSFLAEAADLLAIALEAHPDDHGLLAERIHVQVARGEYTEAARALRDHGSALGLRAAWACEDWELAQGVASKDLRTLRDSRLEGDPHTLAAVCAGVALLRGDAQPYEALLARAPQHPLVLILLARFERRVNRTEALTRLRRLAPHAVAYVNSEEVWL